MKLVILETVIENEHPGARIARRPRARKPVVRNPARCNRGEFQGLVTYQRGIMMPAHPKHSARASSVTAREKMHIETAREKMFRQRQRDRRLARTANGDIADAEGRNIRALRRGIAPTPTRYARYQPGQRRKQKRKQARRR